MKTTVISTFLALALMLLNGEVDAGKIYAADGNGAQIGNFWSVPSRKYGQCFAISTDGQANSKVFHSLWATGECASCTVYEKPNCPSNEGATYTFSCTGDKNYLTLKYKVAYKSVICDS